jgi:hypothetical protein
MQGQGLIVAALAAVAVIVLTLLLRASKRKRAPSHTHVRRATGSALLGLQGFIDPSVEYLLQAQNVEQKEEDDDDGQGADLEAIRSDLADALRRTPVDPEEVRRHLTAAARAGMDWNAVFEQAVRDELRERPFRVPYLPPARRVAPRS